MAAEVEATDMSTTVFKYPIQITDYQTIEMPRGATILCVQRVGDEWVLYARVDPAVPKADRIIRVAGTGHRVELQRMDEQIDYIGTIVDASISVWGVALVWHVFESRLP